jgi:hypothetical protein
MAGALPYTLRGERKHSSDTAQVSSLPEATRETKTNTNGFPATRAGTALQAKKLN